MLSFLLASMLYFLRYSMTYTSPSDLISFLILVFIFNMYMFFRDLGFHMFPDFYMKNIENYQEKCGFEDSHNEEMKNWKKLDTMNMFSCLFAPFLY